MYSAVPPPQSVESNAESVEEYSEGETTSKNQEKLNTASNVGTCGTPSGLSDEKWKKFQELRERRAKCCQSKTTEKRIRRLKNDVTKTVFSEMMHPDEIAALEDRGLIAPLPPKQRQRTKGKSNVSETRAENEIKWKQLIQYSNSSAQCSAKAGQEEKLSKRACEEKRLEERLENAIKEGNLDEAEAINKQLVQQDFASKLLRAVECRDYVKRKAVEEEKVKKKKKSKLHWGFEQKQRWESKGNM